MTEYADHDFYQNTYKGSLDISLFNSLIPKASHEIDKAVNRELKEADITDEVKFVACELVDYLNDYKGTASGNVTSIAIDGVSKSYAGKSIKDYKADIKNITDGLPLELIRFL